ncbi:hypothetical protein ACFYXP_32900 [Streptomyces sp. NPDC002466]|uniref:hypothetical protein n=1 Tax=unclassified Streptomyces TaxID=2593676 RepID=UPI0033178012
MFRGPSSPPRVRPRSAYPCRPGRRRRARARQTAERILVLEAAGCPREVGEGIVLIVSELIPNAVLYAEGPYVLTLNLADGRADIGRQRRIPRAVRAPRHRADTA